MPVGFLVALRPDSPAGDESPVWPQGVDNLVPQAAGDPQALCGTEPGNVQQFLPAQDYVAQTTQSPFPPEALGGGAVLGTGNMTADGTAAGDNFAAANRVLVAGGNNKTAVDSDLEVENLGPEVRVRSRTVQPALGTTLEGGQSSDGAGAPAILRGGNGAGTNRAGGNAIVDGGAATGTGTPGAVNIGTNVAQGVNIGRSGKATFQAGSGLEVTRVT